MKKFKKRGGKKRQKKKNTTGGLEWLEKVSAYVGWASNIQCWSVESGAIDTDIMSHTNCSSEFFILSSRSINFTLLQSRNKSMCCVRFFHHNTASKAFLGYQTSTYTDTQFWQHSLGKSLHSLLIFISLRTRHRAKMAASVYHSKTVIRLKALPGKIISMWLCLPPSSFPYPQFPLLFQPSLSSEQESCLKTAAGKWNNRIKNGKRGNCGGGEKLLHVPLSYASEPAS